MALIIGYLVVLVIVTLDIFYHFKKKKAFLYTPFDFISGHYAYFNEEETEEEKGDKQKSMGK